MIGNIQDKELKQIKSPSLVMADKIMFAIQVGMVVFFFGKQILKYLKK